LACAVAFVEQGTALLEPHHLRVLAPADEATRVDRLPLGGQKLESIERVAIEQTLGLTGGNKAKAANVLGIAVSTLYEKLKRYQLAGERRE
jgi:DNA-binding NtrC family response regulator